MLDYVFLGSGHIRALCRTISPQLLHFRFFLSSLDSSRLFLIRLPQPLFWLTSGFCTDISSCSGGGGQTNLSTLFATLFGDCIPNFCNNEEWMVCTPLKIKSRWSSSSAAMFKKFWISNQARLLFNFILSLWLQSSLMCENPRNWCCSLIAFLDHLGLTNCLDICFTLHRCSAAKECLHR